MDLGEQQMGRNLTVNIGGQSREVNCTTQNGQETCVVDDQGSMNRVCRFLIMAVVLIVAVLVIRCLLSKGDVFSMGGQVRTIESAADYQNLLSQNKPLFVKFYAPWCGHCQQAAPAFAEAARMAQSSSDVVFVKVNGDAAPEIAQAYGVQGFPTFKLVAPGGTAKDVAMSDRSAQSMYAAAVGQK